MPHYVLLQDARYQNWEEKEYEGVEYWQSPDNKKIAYAHNGKIVELTWQRSIGKIGPHQWEKPIDYVHRRLRDRVDKREARGLAAVLNVLAAQYGRK